MDKKLVKPTKQTSAPKAAASSQTTSKGLGKGRPGVARKEEVSLRQKRRRDEMEVTTTRTPPATPPRKIAPRKQPTSSHSTGRDSRNTGPPSPIAQRSPTPFSPPSPEPLTPSSPEPFRPPPRETRQVLDAQITRSSKDKRLAVIQKLSNAGRDEPPNQRELELFWQDMDSWEILDSRIVTGLVDIWNDISKVALSDYRSEEFGQQLVQLQGLANGVKNCVEHYTGAMIREAFRQSEDSAVQVTLETLQVSLKNLRQKEYTCHLEKCGCPDCTAVLEFDETYERYHDAVEHGREMELHDAPPRYADRPNHCTTSELHAQSIKSKFSGMSISSLQRAYYFANSTPPLSPPALSTATPTDVETLTVKYMLQYWKEIEDEAIANCNAEYQVVAGTLSLCTSKELMPTRDPQEIFTHYGSLRKYWISAIAATPNKYPKTMADCVVWLLNSQDCNWTAEQRREMNYK